MSNEKQQDEHRSQWAKNPNVIERLIDGEAVLLDLKTGVYFSLNGTGTDVWNALAAPATVEDVAGRITADYAIDFPTALADAGALLAELESQGLIVKKGCD